MARRVRTFTVPCRSVLTKSKIPSIDYALNPYLGCEHGCVYCYATFMARFHNVPGEWGSYVGVKVDAPSVLAREVARARPGVVSLGTVCDAYQPIEERTRLSRACLEVFEGREEWEVGVLTKSDLVLRDADILGRLAAPDVGFTITCLDPLVARAFEPGAPSPARRLAAMRELSDRGIPVWGFLGPVLPTLTDSEEAIEEVLREMARAGAGRVLVDRMNPYPRAESGLRRVIAREFPDRLPLLRAIRADQGRYEAELADRVESVSRRMGVQADVCF